MFKQCVVVIFVFMIYNILLTSLAVNNNECRLAVTNLTLCKGPKRKDCSINSARMINSSFLRYEFHVLQDVVLEKGKITLFRNGKLIISLQTKKPCDNLFLRPILRSTLNTTKDCELKKGYHAFILNLEDLLKYHGGMYLYGNIMNITAKAIFYNDDCNFSCTVIETENVAKNKTDV